VLPVIDKTFINILSAVYSMLQGPKHKQGRESTLQVHGFCLLDYLMRHLLLSACCIIKTWKICQNCILIGQTKGE